MNYTEDLLEEAKMLAIRAHGLQEYDGFPYDKHLKDVDNVLKEFGYDIKYRICAWLHDIYEDTTINYNHVKKYFGEWVAETVYALTDELGRNRKERHEKTLPKLSKCVDAIIVKLADRIANLRNGKKTNSRQFYMYLKEHDEFKKELYHMGDADEMWYYLDGFVIMEKNKLNK